MTVFRRLLLTQLRRERIVLPLWLGGITLVASGAASAVTTQFGSEAERTAIVEIAVVNPAFLFMRGAPDGISAGALTSFQAFSFMAVAAALMSMFLVTRHTRAVEEDGRAELELATPVRRSAPLLSTLTLALVANLVLAALVAGALVGVGLPAAGSTVFGLAIAAVGVFFAALTALVAQLASTGRAVNGVVGAAIAVAFTLRGMGDALGTADVAALRVDPHPIGLLSPIGLAASARPFTELNALPLVAPVALALLIAAVALSVRERRGLGAGLLEQGRGPAHLAGLRGPLGLAARQSRTAVIAWALGAAALGVLGAALSPLVASVVSESDSLAELVEALLPGTSTDSSTVFVSGLLGITGMLAACAAAQAMLRMRADESSGRSELLLSTPLTRSRLLLSQSAVAAGAVIIITGAVGIAVWITAIATDAPGDADLAVAGLAHAPAAAVFIALPALLIALVPRIAVGATWLLLAVSVVIGQLGEMLELPDAIRVLSPFSHVSAVPVEEVDGAEVALLLGIAVVAVGLAAVLARRRELVAG